MAASVERPQALEGQGRVADQHDGEVVEHGDLGGQVPDDHRTHLPGARTLHERVTVLVVAPDGEERIASPGRPAVDGHAGEDGVEPAPDERALATPDEVGDGERRHERCSDRWPSRATRISRATSRSSNGNVCPATIW